MTPAQQALFDTHLPYARKLARIYTRSAPGYGDEYHSAALLALAESAETFVEGTRGTNGKLTTFKTYAIKRLKYRLNDVTRFARRKKRKPDGRRVDQSARLDQVPSHREVDPFAFETFAEVLALLPDDRQREMVRLRYVESATLQEIGDRFGCSRQRVGQLLDDALGFLRVAILEQPPRD